MIKMLMGGVGPGSVPGEGYSDILIRTEHRIGIVIEVKYADDGDLEKGCAEALEQKDI